jgi:hypothetical protein
VQLPESLAELNFGGSVALAGSTAVVSMPETYYGNGRAFAYGAAADGTLTFEAELHPSDGASDFGVEVATAGDRVAVGATQHSHGTITGAVYLYQRVAPAVWVEEAELVATSSGLTGKQLGHSVALDGNLCAAGAPDIEGAGPGEVLVFHRTLSGAWIEEAVLKPSSPFAQMAFGGRIALEGDLLAAAADELVYVFRRLPHGNWVEEARLDVPGLSVFSFLQGDLALFGGRLAVGVPEDTPSTGKVRVFVKGPSGWILQAQLTAPEMGDGLGNSVAFDGGLLVAGAPEADSPLPTSGAVHTWRDNGLGAWTYAGRLDPQPSLAPDPKYVAYIGVALAFDAGRLAAGAPGQAPGGAVVVWQTLPDCP